MSNGTYDDFLEALRTHASGWDRSRYQAGRLDDVQLNLWAGGTASDFYPGLKNWGHLNDEQWRAMAYRSVNERGFVGCRFGEPLLIDLGYYEAETFYENGEAINGWRGDWTGRHGINRLDDFKTGTAQETALREAFGFYLQIFEIALGERERAVADLLDRQDAYRGGDSEIGVPYSLSGLLAAAHLRGVFEILALLVGERRVTGERGAAFATLLSRFGDYDMPDPAELMSL